MRDMKKLSKKTKRIILITTSCILLIGSILYALADRYLIEHVEVSDTNKLFASSSSQIMAMVTSTIN